MKDVTSNNAVDSIMDVTTNRNKTTKPTILTTVKATPTIILVEMTVMTSEATIRRTDMEITTTTATDQMTNRVNTILMARTTEMARTDTTRTIKSARDSRQMKTIILMMTT